MIKMKKKKIYPKISVIVAVYNQEKYIGRCIRSLLHQSLPHSDYEIIVVDDGSVDLTSYALDLFCDPFDSMVKVFTNKSNKGLPASVNKALMKAQAPFVVRVDSDDFVNSNFLNFLSAYLEMNTEVDAVACDYLLIDDMENELRRCNCDEEPIACGILFKKKHLFEIGLYDESFRYNEELDLRIRFEKKFKIKRLDMPLYRYRRHENNMTNDTINMNHHRKNLVAKHGTQGIKK